MAPYEGPRAVTAAQRRCTSVGPEVALRQGTVWVSDHHPYVPQAELGGIEQSGVGRELGPAGLAEWRETKRIWRTTNPSAQGWFG
ncbi:aldehyde dehydrogenase family protein [Streptomyces sp. NBC_00286]